MCSSKQHRRHHLHLRAFTLIEVLVVVAIMALLIAILLPSLKRARENSKSVVCLTRLRQVGLAATYYGNANEGYLPPLRLPFNVQAGATLVQRPYQFQYLPGQYLKHVYDVAVCPSHDLINAETGQPQQPYYALNSGKLTVHFSYGMNSALPKRGTPVYPDVPSSATTAAFKIERYNPSLLNRIDRPADTIYLFETASHHSFNGRSELLHFRRDHGGEKTRMNILFADSHAEPREIKKVWPGDFSTDPPTAADNPALWSDRYRILWLGSPKAPFPNYQ
jgi:prepilin-type N-terminal cleavage/methylation domain-containing protein/prepilin-type processing-associated H-X9-DG protein